MTSEKKTLRLLMPQWQGGNNPIYYLGAQLLYWLAPKGDADFAEVPVAAPDGSQLPLEGGVLGKSAILKQNEAALDIIRQSAPDRIVTFWGGDCSVSLAPFSYLALLCTLETSRARWVDAHFDLTTSDVSTHAHGYPMLNLLGCGVMRSSRPGGNLFELNDLLTSASIRTRSPSAADAPSKNGSQKCLILPNCLKTSLRLWLG